MARKKREINTSLLDSVTADMLSNDDVDFFQDNSLRVERILLELVRPDPLQPRRVLPGRVYQSFHDNRLTPTQALRELIQTAQLAARQQGRPFTNVLDLLGNPDDESEQELAPLSPEEQLVHDLVNLAITIRDDGQVNPLTVVDVSEGVSRQFRIETGERRYWATWLLRDFIAGYESDGMIPCIIIPNESASASRQAKENTARSGLSAIAMARQAALLLLYVHGYEMPIDPVPTDFYRQALDLDMRGKREFSSTILSAMGGISKSQFRRYKALLQLSDEAIELADRASLHEGKLRHVIPLPIEEHHEMLRHIIEFGLTVKQIKEICEQEQPSSQAEEDQAISKQALQLARLIRNAGDATASDLAKTLLQKEKQPEIALARIQGLKQLIEEVENFLVSEM